MLSEHRSNQHSRWNSTDYMNLHFKVGIIQLRWIYNSIDLYLSKEDNLLRQRECIECFVLLDFGGHKYIIMQF